MMDVDTVCGSIGYTRLNPMRVVQPGYVTPLCDFLWILCILAAPNPCLSAMHLHQPIHTKIIVVKQGQYYLH